MERVRKIKKENPTFYTYPLLLTSLSAVFIFFLRFSLAPSLKGGYVERLAKNKNTLTIFGFPASNLLLTFYPVLVFYWSQSLPFGRGIIFSFPKSEYIAGYSKRQIDIKRLSVELFGDCVHGRGFNYSVWFKKER